MFENEETIVVNDMESVDEFKERTGATDEDISKAMNQDSFDPTNLTHRSWVDKVVDTQKTKGEKQMVESKDDKVKKKKKEEEKEETEEVEVKDEVKDDPKKKPFDVKDNEPLAEGDAIIEPLKKPELTQEEAKEIKAKKAEKEQEDKKKKEDVAKQGQQDSVKPTSALTKLGVKFQDKKEKNFYKFGG